MVPVTKQQLADLVTGQMMDTYEELAPQLIQLIDMTKKRTDITDDQKWDEILLHMMGYVKSCTNEIMIEVLAEILGLQTDEPVHTHAHQQGCGCHDEHCGCHDDNCTCK